jgi:hypothetical protein
MDNLAAHKVAADLKACPRSGVSSLTFRPLISSQNRFGHYRNASSLDFERLCIAFGSLWTTQSPASPKRFTR